MWYSQNQVKWKDDFMNLTWHSYLYTDSPSFYLYITVWCLLFSSHHWDAFKKCSSLVLPTLTRLNWFVFRGTIHMCKAMHILKHFKGQGQIFLSRSFKPNWGANLSQTRSKPIAELCNVLKCFLNCTSAVGSEFVGSSLYEELKTVILVFCITDLLLPHGKRGGNDLISNPVLVCF